MASDCCQPPAECRSPAGYLTKTQEFGCTPKPRVSAQVHLFARLAHLHYPLSLTTHDVSLCRYPRGTRTRETGLAWYKAPGRYFIRLGQARARTAGSECCRLSPESLCPNVYTIHIVKELFGASPLSHILVLRGIRPSLAKKKPRLVRTSRGFSLGASLEGSMFEPSRNHLRKAYVIGSPLFVASTSIRSNAIGAGMRHRRTAPSSPWLTYDCQRPRTAFVKPSCLFGLFIGRRSIRLNLIVSTLLVNFCSLKVNDVHIITVCEQFWGGCYGRFQASC